MSVMTHSFVLLFQQPNQQRKKKTKINSRHPPSIPTLPYAVHTAGSDSVCDQMSCVAGQGNVQGQRWMNVCVLCL